MGFFQGRGTAMWMVVTMVVHVYVWASCGLGVKAVNYRVGDPSGWTLRSSYDGWLAGKTFRVGDTLEFVYTNSHNVVEVSEAEYEGCSQGNNVPKTDGDTTYTLSAEGAHYYYICSVAGHCEGGMKVAVTTVEAASSPTPTASPVVSPPASAPASTNTSSPPNSSPLPIFSSYPFFTSILIILCLSLFSIIS